METEFKVDTPIFNGPLDLLLDLIEKKKLFINDVALSKVADDYIEYVKKLNDFPVSQSAQFVLIASTLLLIKSKSLLPSLVLTSEEEGNIKDLERRLVIYQRMRELSSHVKNRFGIHVIFERGDRSIEPVFSPDKSMTIENILFAVKDVILSLPKKELIPKAIIEKVISLEEMIENLTKRITTGLKMSFKQFTGEHKGDLPAQAKVSVIVSFLAMLELVKQGVINVTRDKHFEDITMETDNVGVPTYK